MSKNEIYIGYNIPNGKKELAKEVVKYLTQQFGVAYGFFEIRSDSDNDPNEGDDSFDVVLRGYNPKSIPKSVLNIFELVARAYYDGAAGRKE